jgi:hypothetical protein
MSQTTVDWDTVVAGQYVYDPAGVPWRVVSRWSDGTVVLINEKREEAWLRPCPRGPVVVEGSATMEEAVGVLQSVLGARVIEVSG